ACEVIGWAAACVVNGDHDAARRGPDAYGHRRAAVALRVGDCLGDADQQVVERGGGDAAAADLRERVPGIGGGPVDQLDKGRGVFERIGGVREAFECRGVLVAVACPAFSRGGDDEGVRSLDDVEHRRWGGGGV